jgi:predicted nucleotidyltransferase
MSALDDVLRYREELRRIAAEFGARNPRLFGSAVRREDRPGSDIDILIDIDPDDGFRRCVAIADAFERILGRPVDLVTERGLNPRLKPSVLAEAIPL